MLVHRKVTLLQHVPGTHLYTWAQLFKGRLALNLNFFFLRSKAFSRIIFSVTFKVNLYTKGIKTEMLFKLSNLNSNLALTLGYLNPALNNLALGEERQSGVKCPV